MAAVDTISPRFRSIGWSMVNEDLPSVASPGDTFRVFQVECDVRELRQQLCLAHETQLTTSRRRTRIFRVQTGQRGEFHLAGINLLREIT